VRAVRWTSWKFPGLGVFLLLFAIYNIATRGFSSGLIAGLAIAAFFLSLPLLSRLQQKRLYAKCTSMHGRLCLDVDDEGLGFSGPGFSSNVGWPHFYKYCEDAKSFVVYQQSRMVVNIIPKRSLTDEQMAQLREYLDRHLSSHSPAAAQRTVV